MRFERKSTPITDRSVERGVQGVLQVPGPNFSGGPEILEISRAIFMQRWKI